MGKIFREIIRPVKQATGLVKNVAGGLFGGSPQQPQPQQQAPVQTPAQSAIQAANTGIPEKDIAEETSESSKRKTRSRGKKTLTVSRESGKGVNL